MTWPVATILPSGWRARSKVAPAPLGNRSLNGVRATPSPSRPKVRSGEPSELSRATAQPPSKESFATLPARTIFPSGWRTALCEPRSPGDGHAVAAAEGGVHGAVGVEAPDAPAAGGDDLAVGCEVEVVGVDERVAVGLRQQDEAAFAEGGVEGAVGVEPADPVAGARLWKCAEEDLPVRSHRHAVDGHAVGPADGHVVEAVAAAERAVERAVGIEPGDPIAGREDLAVGQQGDLGEETVVQARHEDVGDAVPAEGPVERSVGVEAGDSGGTASGAARQPDDHEFAVGLEDAVVGRADGRRHDAVPASEARIQVARGEEDARSAASRTGQAAARGDSA